MDVPEAPENSEAVELYYCTARSDVREVLRWRAAGAPGARGQLLIWLLLLPLAVCAAIVVQHGRETDPAALAFAAGAGVCLGGVFLALDWWRTARRMYAWASEYPEYRCTVSGAGMTSHRPDGSTAATVWHQLTGWAETRGLFVFEYHGTGDLAWLPKRGALTPAELEQVRGLIDRNLRRL